MSPVDLSLSADAVHFRGGFGVHRGGAGWEMQWDGTKILALAVEAARRGINEVSSDMASMARDEHPWENRTFQTRDAIFSQAAEIEVAGTTPASTPHVWGAWGVEWRKRYVHASLGGAPERDERGKFAPQRRHRGKFISLGAILPTEEEEDVSTVDVAMFLEFGTKRAPPLPFLYPAWDAHKVRLPAVIAKHYRELAALDWRTWRFSNEFADLRRMFGATFWKV